MILALRSRPDLWRFVKFLVVGVANTAFGFAVYAVLLRLFGLPWQWALGLSYVLGVLWNFVTHGRIVFGTQGLAPAAGLCAGLRGALLLNKWVLSATIDAGMSELWAQALLVFPMAMVAFVLVSLALTGRLPFAKGSR